MTDFFDALTTIYCRERNAFFNSSWERRVLTQILKTRHYNGRWPFAANGGVDLVDGDLDA